MGTGNILLGGNPEMDYHPVQGGSSNIPGFASCFGNRYKLRSCGPLPRVRLYLLVLEWNSL